MAPRLLLTSEFLFSLEVLYSNFDHIQIIINQALINNADKMCINYVKKINFINH